MTILEKIGHFITDLSYDTLPEIVTTAVKRAFTDTLGVCIAGVKEDSSIIISNYVKAKQSKPVCSVIGAGFKADPADAALANGIILHAIDFDDTGAFTQGHPSAPIFPVILAIAEENKNNGKEIIEAYTVGVEVLSRLARSMPMMHLKGWHPTSILGSIAGTAAAAKLLKLNIEKTICALSLAGSMSSGLIKNFGTMAKPFHIGNACSNSIVATKLAENGFSASNELFDGNLSLLSAFFWNEENKIDEMIDSIGTPLAVTNPGINIKKFPACSLTHRSIDAMLKICNTFSLHENDVLRIDCRVPPRAKQVLFYNSPKSGLEGKFSMHFVLSLSFKYKSVLPSHFTDEFVSNPEIKHLMKKINFEVHDDWRDGDDARGDVVTVTLKDGTKHTETVVIPNGNVKKPLTDEELKEKFNNCALDFLNKEEISFSLKIINKLESLNSVNPLMDLVNKKMSILNGK